MQMKFIGLFKDIDPGISAAAPTLQEAMGGLTEEATTAVAAYLKRGTGVCDFMHPSWDPVIGESISGEGPTLVSDGEWIWRDDLRYFVKKYRVILPDEFLLRTMKQRQDPIDSAAILKRKAFEYAE